MSESERDLEIEWARGVAALELPAKIAAQLELAEVDHLRRISMTDAHGARVALVSGVNRKTARLLADAAIPESEGSGLREGLLDVPAPPALREALEAEVAMRRASGRAPIQSGCYAEACVARFVEKGGASVVLVDVDRQTVLCQSLRLSRKHVVASSGIAGGSALAFSSILVFWPQGMIFATGLLAAMLASLERMRWI